MYADQAQVPEWRPDGEEPSERRRVLSIEDLRKRLGVAAPEEQAAKPRRTEAPADGMMTRPRIVKRGEPIASC